MSVAGLSLGVCQPSVFWLWMLVSCLLGRLQPFVFWLRMSVACLLGVMSAVCVLASDISSLAFAGIGQMSVCWVRVPGACVLDGYFCHMYSTVYSVQYVWIGSL